MWPLLLLLHGLTSSYWVVTGYSYPPNLVAGPYATWNDCEYVARELNRVNLTYVFHCTMY
jgi:hypothetical protein